MLRVEVSPEVVATLQEIDRRREGLTPIAALSPEEQKRWAQAYAEDAVKHGAWIDGDQLDVLNANLRRVVAGEFDHLIADFAAEAKRERR